MALDVGIGLRATLLRPETILTSVVMIEGETYKEPYVSYNAIDLDSHELRNKETPTSVVIRLGNKETPTLVVFSVSKRETPIILVGRGAEPGQTLVGLAAHGDRRARRCGGGRQGGPGRARLGWAGGAHPPRSVRTQAGPTKGAAAADAVGERESNSSSQTTLGEERTSLPLPILVEAVFGRRSPTPTPNPS